MFFLKYLPPRDFYFYRNQEAEIIGISPVLISMYIHASFFTTTMTVIKFSLELVSVYTHTSIFISDSCAEDIAGC